MSKSGVMNMYMMCAGMCMMCAGAFLRREGPEKAGNCLSCTVYPGYYGA